MKLRALVLISLLLFSCSKSDDTGRIESLKVLESYALEKFYQGNEEMASMRILSRERNDPAPQTNRALILHTQMLHVDSLTDQLISELNSIRSKIIGRKIPKGIELCEPVQLSYGVQLKLQDKHLFDSKEINEIISKIESYRNNLCNSIFETIPLIWPEKKSSQLIIPNNLLFANDKEKEKAIRSIVEKSDLYYDEQYAILSIMMNLTEQEETWTSMLTTNEDWIDLSMGLISIQQKILSARWQAMRHINLMIGCRADYNFTKIEPIVQGTSFAQANDTVQIEVFFAGYNEFFEQQLISTKGAKFLKFEGGKAYLEAIIPASGELEMSGEISILKKSGSYSNPMSWSHTIKVIEPKR